MDHRCCQETLPLPSLHAPGTEQSRDSTRAAGQPHERRVEQKELVRAAPSGAETLLFAARFPGLPPWANLVEPLRGLAVWSAWRPSAAVLGYSRGVPPGRNRLEQQGQRVREPIESRPEVYAIAMTRARPW